jgi:hypothetical protein
MSEVLPQPQHRQLAVELFNHVWALLEKPDRTADEDAEMIHAAHASRHHWSGIGGPKQFSIGEWQISRVYTTLGRAEPAIYHGRLALGWAERGDLGPFYVGYAYEALARAEHLANDPDFATALAAANACLAEVEKADNAEALRADLKSIAPAAEHTVKVVC